MDVVGILRDDDDDNAGTFGALAAESQLSDLTAGRFGLRACDV